MVARDAVVRGLGQVLRRLSGLDIGKQTERGGGPAEENERGRRAMDAELPPYHATLE